MTTLTIRTATREDRHTRWQITHEAWKVAYAHIYTPQEIEDVFDDLLFQRQSWGRNRGELLGHLVAERDGRVIGFVGMALCMHGRGQPQHGEITALYVLPDEQGRGAGRLLWQSGLEALRARDCTAAWVWTLQRASAVDFYRRMGATATAHGVYTIGNHEEPAIGFLIPL